MTLTLLAIGTFGLLGLSVLCPVLALPGYYFRHRFTGQKTALQPRRPDTPLRIEIVLPAHNEEERIGVTLASIHRAIRRLQVDVLTPPSPEVTVCVGANGCTDQTALTARKFPFVSVPEFPKSSKWITLKTLCMASQADWIFLVDAGTLWPENFLSEVLPRIRERENLLAVAPAYRPWRSGWLHQALWFIETCLKRFETLCGGPVSLHGATVGYKVSHLKKALAWLGDRPWLNDDVVIPLILRTLY